jgi:hypothetical protein
LGIDQIDKLGNDIEIIAAEQEKLENLKTKNSEIEKLILENSGKIEKIKTEIETRKGLKLAQEKEIDKLVFKKMCHQND